MFSRRDERAEVLAADPPPALSATPEGDESGESGESGKRDVLGDLRRRMDAMLARAPAGDVGCRSESTFPELPFALESTPLGPLYVRTLRFGGEHRVGRVPIAGGRMASCEHLGNLALDPSLSTCSPAGALYLDTETTGLGPGAGTVAFLIGLAFWGTESELVCEQLLVRQLGEEAPALARVAERIASASMLVTFNGKSFDLPVLRARFVMARATFPVPPPHLDLVHLARRLHKGRGFGARLSSVENHVLGFERIDDVPSSEVSACYLHFLRTGDTRALLKVIDHNLWDVVSMAALVALYGDPLDPSLLHADDLVGVARTLKRARQNDHAERVADAALERGAGAAALRVRAEISMARGDKARALRDFEAVARTASDPSVRFELAKLYEHHAKDAARALAVVEAGTGEDERRLAHRAARLTRKVNETSGNLW